MTVTRVSADARPSVRAACRRSVRWFRAPRLARARRRRALLAAAALAASTIVHTLVTPRGAVLHDAPADAPFALVLRTTVPTPFAGARVTLRLTVVNAGGWWATLTVQPTMAPQL